MLENKNDWFKTWFDTSYYHILYQNRDFKEAERFISNLLNYFQFPSGTNCLDLACGKGRHSVFLNKNGLNVTGVDLSENSIREAQRFENDTLSFYVHDMRKVYKANAFDVVFNLFTSFGYFDSYGDNLKVLESVNKMLVKEGKLVIDFMNVDFVLQNLVKEEVKVMDGITFHISRHYDGRNIYKDIYFTDKGKAFNFQEKVQAIKKEEFESLLEQAGFNILDVFGDFSLAPFDQDKSDRLIIVAEKK